MSVLSEYFLFLKKVSLSVLRSICALIADNDRSFGEFASSD